MAFSERLPRNSESRAISICFKLIKKHYPNIEWILSFSDATRCGDGTIYRAAGFVLTQINRNSSIIKLPDGTVTASITYTAGKNILKMGGAATLPEGAEYLDGFQLRYIYFIQPAARERLTVPIIPCLCHRRGRGHDVQRPARFTCVRSRRWSRPVTQRRCDTDPDAPFLTMLAISKSNCCITNMFYKVILFILIFCFRLPDIC